MGSQRSLIKILSTFFYVGYLPFIPGTFGSAAGVIIFFFIRYNTFAQLAVISILIITGLVITGKAEGVFGRKDPKYIVIDEVAGMLLSLLFLPYDIRLVVMVFFVFRLLDTLKPCPAGAIQRLHGSVGIMGDDIIAGLYTNIVIQAVLRLVSFKAS